MYILDLVLHTIKLNNLAKHNHISINQNLPTNIR